MVTKAITKAFEVARKRNWDRTYWAIDLHDSVLRSTYTETAATEFYEGAIETLQLLTARKDVVLIMYTSSHKRDVQFYLELFRNLGIDFAYVNENPEVKNTEYADFERKMYFNVLVDDKAGFDPNTDWKLVSTTVLGIPALQCLI